MTGDKKQDLKNEGLDINKSSNVVSPDDALMHSITETNENYIVSIEINGENHDIKISKEDFLKTYENAL